LLAVALMACLMSMIDGLLVASGYALVVDIFKPGSKLDDLDASPKTSKTLIAKVRLAFFGLAILGCFGITYFLGFLGLSVFDILYFVVVPHLSLFGPVFASLVGRRGGKLSMSWAILVAAVVGWLAVYLGTKHYEEYKWLLVDGAGLLTIIASTACAFLISRASEVNNEQQVTSQVEG
jgi:hypothetical protein